MEIKHFHTLPVGATFVIDGEAFTKKDEVSVRNAYGVEQMIDPIMDAKLGKALGLVEAPVAASTPIKLQGKVNADGQLVVTFSKPVEQLFIGADVTVDGTFDGNVFVVKGISGSR